ncbi:MAG: four helix bundle protein [Gammaproteobacteria bacterium]|nr:four helix bundle protein [Gammaproteobacteria bacterium]
MKRKHHELEVWQTAIELVEEIYAITSGFPKHERFGLVSQLRRCSVSVPSNIAEGSARLTAREFLHFLGMARGSLSEMETQLIIASRLGYLDTMPTERIERVFALLGGLINHQRKRIDL